MAKPSSSGDNGGGYERVPNPLPNVPEEYSEAERAEVQELERELIRTAGGA